MTAASPLASIDPLAALVRDEHGGASAHGADARSLDDALHRAVERARRNDHCLWLTGVDSIERKLDPLALFAAAEARGESRFFESRPSEGLVQVAVGAAAQVVDVARGSGLTAAVAEIFDRIEHVCDAGPVPRLYGGLAFEPRPASPGTGLARGEEWQAFGDGRFVLPELALVENGGERWLAWAIRVDPHDDPRTLAARARRRWADLLRAFEQETPAAAHIDAPEAAALEIRYARRAAELLEEIHAGRLRKVVLAAREPLSIEGAIPASAVLRALLETHPTCLGFAQGIGHATFLGSTPERLVRVNGLDVEACALAGTSARGVESPVHKDLVGSAKEREEQRLVVEAIETVLRPYCSEFEVSSEPELLGTAHAQHLHSTIAGRLRAPAHILELADALHPTPAVAGTPRERALECIRRSEEFDRGWYAGPIGWVDEKGSGELHVALRCGLLLPGRALLYAGAGLVDGSDPALEAAETRLKLRALREALERVCAR